MKRARKTLHELGYRFYRGHIYRRVGAGERCNLWSPEGRFICALSLRILPRYVDKSIKFGWESPAAPAVATEFEQLEMFKEAA